MDVLTKPKSRRIGVACLVTHQDPAIRKILACERLNEPGKGWIAVPGGKVEPEETITAGALRELEEETGMFGLLISKGPFPYTEDFFPELGQYFTTFYVPILSMDTPKNVEPTKHSPWFWQDWDRLPMNIWRGMDHIYHTYDPFQAKWLMS